MSLAAGDGAALGPCGGKRVLHGVESGCVHQWTHQRARIERITDGQPLIDALQPGHKRRVDVLVHDQSPQARAALSRRAHRREHDGARRESRSADGATIIALLPPSSRMHLPNRAATFGPTARPIRVDPVAEMTDTSGLATNASPTTGPPIMTCERASGASPKRASARARICWVASADKRRLLGRLPDHRIAADQGQRRVPAPHRHRKVERRDHAAHAGGCQLSRIACPGRSEAMVRP